MILDYMSCGTNEKAGESFCGCRLSIIVLTLYVITAYMATALGLFGGRKFTTIITYPGNPSCPMICTIPEAFCFLLTKFPVSDW